MTTDPQHADASRVLPDPADARDHTFEPADPARPLPDSVPLDTYRHYVRETWYQRGHECTGFALAAVANYTIRRDLDDPHFPSVSRRMLYEMAQFYDGEAYQEGSTLRGALKGWRRVGVTLDDLWPYVPGDEDGAAQGRLTLARLLDARTRRLLRYARIPCADIRTMQHALAEGRALYACGRYHLGWMRMYLPGAEPVIEQRPDDRMGGGHAFVIAGYDRRGFWIHNSFGMGWGDGGYALLPYADWQANGQDVWVIEAQAVQTPWSGVVAPRVESAATPRAPETLQAVDADRATGEPAYRTLWPHLVVLRDDGTLASTPAYEKDPGSVGTLLYLFVEQTRGWAQRRLAVFADGGGRPLAQTVERLLALREQLMAREIYPIFLVWETSWQAELAHDLDVWLQRVGGADGISPADPLAAQALGSSVARELWGKLIERSQAACRASAGGAKLLAAKIAARREDVPFELHLVSHGAGDLLLDELLDLVPTPLATFTAIAPVTPVARFCANAGRLLDRRQLGCVHVHALDDAAEQADRVGPVAGSLPTLVSHHLASVGVEVADASGASVPVAAAPEPVLGLARCLAEDPRLTAWLERGWLQAKLVPGLGHDDLPFDPDVQRALVQGILAASPKPAAQTRQTS